MVKSRKKRKKHNKSLKSNINKYILKKQDICCEENFERNEIIKQIFDLYKKKDKNEYLDWIDNDLVVFIGYKTDLIKNKDYRGATLWEELNKRMKSKNKQQQIIKIKKLMSELPLYYLLSFLGVAYYKYSKRLGRKITK